MSLSWPIVGGAQPLTAPATDWWPLTVGAFSLGDAAMVLNQPIVGMAEQAGGVVIG